MNGLVNGRSLAMYFKTSPQPVISTIGKSFDSYPLTEWVVNNERLLLVADTGKKLLGFLVVRPKGDEASIDVFCYDKRTKVQNLKEDLLGKAEELIDVNRMTVFLPKGDKLLPFFKKHKYEIYDEISDLYGKKKDALLLVKNISKGPKLRSLLKSVKKNKGKEKIHLDDNLDKLDAYLDF